MGTRADFYVGRNPETMKWLGSIAWDGYPNGLPKRILNAKTEETFTRNVAQLSERDDFTPPQLGWPWPWDDSNTTDFAYAFAEGQVWVACFGSGWVDVETAMNEEYDWKKEHPAPLPFPDMAPIKKVTFGKRSGVLIFGG